jgi:hypothetical protein
MNSETTKKPIFKKWWNFALSTFVIVGCAATLTPAQQSYMSKVNAASTTFRIPKNQSDNAWQRAQVFVSKYSSLTIQSTTNNVLETKSPVGKLYAFGYNVNRLDIGDSTEFSVSCSTGNNFATGKANDNAHICADYIASGQLPYPELINK